MLVFPDFFSCSFLSCWAEGLVYWGVEPSLGLLPVEVEGGVVGGCGWVGLPLPVLLGCLTFFFLLPFLLGLLVDALGPVEDGLLGWLCSLLPLGLLGTLLCWPVGLWALALVLGLG